MTTQGRAAGRIVPELRCERLADDELELAAADGRVVEGAPGEQRNPESSEISGACLRDGKGRRNLTLGRGAILNEHDPNRRTSDKGQLGDDADIRHARKLLETRDCILV